jgi:hypothetical protein
MYGVLPHAKATAVATSTRTAAIHLGTFLGLVSGAGFWPTFLVLVSRAGFWGKTAPLPVPPPETRNQKSETFFTWS